MTRTTRETTKTPRGKGNVMSKGNTTISAWQLVVAVLAFMFIVAPALALMVVLSVKWIIWILKTLAL